jgi:hypothetical protein
VKVADLKHTFCCCRLEELEELVEEEKEEA